jgi:hypothetical protein
MKRIDTYGCALLLAALFALPGCGEPEEPSPEAESPSPESPPAVETAPEIESTTTPETSDEGEPAAEPNPQDAARVERIHVIGIATSRYNKASKDSDEAVILYDALARQKDMTDHRRAADLLYEAIELAEKAAEFDLSPPAPLPIGFPEPSLPGLLRVKSYPLNRQAYLGGPEGDRDAMFRRLLQHIRRNEIEMTSPVLLHYREDDGKLVGPTSMAFFYEHPKVGNTGNFGAVEVRDESAKSVISVGRFGAYSAANFRTSREKLQAWLMKNPQWQADGELRILAYHDPETPDEKKYAEVQLEIRAPPKKANDRLNVTNGARSGKTGGLLRTIGRSTGDRSERLIGVYPLHPPRLTKSSNRPLPGRGGRRRPCGRASPGLRGTPRPAAALARRRQTGSAGRRSPASRRPCRPGAARSDRSSCPAP